MPFKLIIFSLIFFLFSSLLAQRADLNFSKMRYGQEIPVSPARLLALGGSGLAGGGTQGALMLNPALSMQAEKMIEFHVGGLTNHFEEDRSFPYYDSFVGFNDYGSYSFNAHWYHDFYGTLLVRLPLLFGQRVNLSAGYQPFMDFNYNYLEEVRDPVDKSDKLLGYNRIQHEGKLNSIPFGVAVSPFSRFSLGVQLSYLFGSIDSIVTIEPKLYPDMSIARTERAKKEIANTPLISKFGAHYQFSDHLALAGTVQLPFTVRFERKFTDSRIDTVINSRQSFDYPISWGVGLDYRFTNPLEARLMMDFRYDLWSGFKDKNRTAFSFNDTYQFNTGVEHIFFDRVPFRVGFSFGNLRESKELTRTMLSIGTGFITQNVCVNIAGGVSSMEFYQNDLFAESVYNLPERTDSDRVRTTEYFARLDFSYQLGL